MKNIYRVIRGSDDGLFRSRSGDGWCIWKNAGDTASGTVVPNGAGEFQAITAGMAAVITGLYMHLSTASDDMSLEVGCTANADGSGTFTAMTPEFRIETGATNFGIEPHIIHFVPPLYVKDTTGAAIAVRITTNDDAATYYYGLHGWQEEY